MSNTPAVSVVMPVYNRERFVVRAINSILSQHFRDFELIVVDDGSTDRTRDAINAFEDSRIRAVSLPANRGNAEARNAGIELSRGEFIATMDSDDVSLPDRLGKQLECLRAHPQIDVLGTNLFKCMPGGMVRQKHSPEDGVIKARLLDLNGTAMIHPTTMMRKAFLDAHGLRYPDVRTDVDHAIWIEAMATGARFSVLQDYLVEYHRHGGNLVTGTGPEFAGHESRKTPMRARVLSLFFPVLAAKETTAIARLMELARRHTREDALAAIAAIQKALKDSTSHLGESKSEVSRTLIKYMNAAVRALRQRRGRTK
ncbi:MAG: glycosyltransferase family 2 protein [Sphingomonadaceae bacterium]|nr:glycosyltransferase family 2 protein [Sphingomonadaceae bacterium]